MAVSSSSQSNGPVVLCFSQGKDGCGQTAKTDKIFIFRIGNKVKLKPLIVSMEKLLNRVVLRDAGPSVTPKKLKRITIWNSSNSDDVVVVQAELSHKRNRRRSRKDGVR